VLNGHVAAFNVPAEGPVESKAERTEQYKHNTTNVTDNSSFFNLINKSSPVVMLMLSIQNPLLYYTILMMFCQDVFIVRYYYPPIRRPPNYA
jgi:hypothetical protein